MSSVGGLTSRQFTRSGYQLLRLKLSDNLTQVGALLGLPAENRHVYLLRADGQGGWPSHHPARRCG